MLTQKFHPGNVGKLQFDITIAPLHFALCFDFSLLLLLPCPLYVKCFWRSMSAWMAKLLDKERRLFESVLESWKRSECWLWSFLPVYKNSVCSLNLNGLFLFAPSRNTWWEGRWGFLYVFIKMHKSYSYCALNSEPQPLVFVKNLERVDGHSEKCWESQSSSVPLGGQCINRIWQTHSSTREESGV